MAEQSDGDGILEAAQGGNSLQRSEQSGDSSQVSAHGGGSRQVLELTGYSRQEIEHGGGSRQELEQDNNMREELQEVGAVVEEPGIEVQQDTNEEAVLTGLVSTRVELAQDVLMEVVPDLPDGNELTAADNSNDCATSPPGQRVPHKTAKGGMQTYAWNTLHQLEYTVKHLTGQLHKVCMLCKDGLDLHQQSLDNLHHEVDSCSKSFYSFLSKMNELEKQSSALESLEGSIKSVNVQLRELENLFDNQTVMSSSGTI